jgi:hypothetical protein
MSTLMQHSATSWKGFYVKWNGVSDATINDLASFRRAYSAPNRLAMHKVEAAQ